MKAGWTADGACRQRLTGSLARSAAHLLRYFLLYYFTHTPWRRPDPHRRGVASLSESWGRAEHGVTGRG